MYKAAAAANAQNGQAAGGAEPQGGAKNDDGVVDADFKEV